MSASPCLVTGASGFVGRHLCQYLTERGYPVHAAVRREQVLPFPTTVVGDLAPDTDWRAALQGVTSVVHLAARVHIMDDRAADPLAAFRLVNVAATEQLARAAAAAGVKRLVYVSSVKVNGEVTPDQPFRESDEPAPEDAYGLSKWEAEQKLAHIAAETGLEVVVLRPPLVYGPGVGANFRRLMALAAKGWPLPLAAIDNRRSLVFVGNLCAAIETCLSHPLAANRTFLVSDGEDVSTADLIRRLARQLGAADRLWPLPVSLLKLLAGLAGKSAEIARLTDSLRLDSSALQRQLAWQPPFSLDQGLGQTIADFKKTTP